MNNTLVSIIMPLFNSEKHVREAIESVMAQTYQEWELLAVNDCSKDNTVNIVQSLAQQDPRIHLLHTEKQSGGPAAPRNLGIQNAKGRFIAFLDSDDLWYPNKLAEQLPLFEQPNTVIVFSYYQKMRENSNNALSVVQSPKYVNYNQLLKGNVIGNLTGIYDTTKIDKQYFMPLGHEDYIHWLHILKQGGIAINTEKVHAIYRISCKSVSSNKFKVFAWDWYIYRYVEHLSFPYSCYCFAHYAIKGILKYLK